MEFKNMIAGIGFKSKVTITSFNEVLEKYIKKYSAFTIATSKEKAKNDVFLKFVITNHLKLIRVDEDAVSNIITPTVSDMSKKFKNVGSFCEAAALVAGGSAFKIICERKISSDRLATIAIAEMDGV